MRKLLIPLSAVVMIAGPAGAVGIGDLAKVVLGGKSVLKKAETKCGSSLALTPQENGTIDLAVSALKKQMAPKSFLLADQRSQVEATTAANDPNFCNETKVKKKGILGKIGKAGKAIGGQVLKGTLGL